MSYELPAGFERVYQGGWHNVYCDGTRHIWTDGGWAAKLPLRFRRDGPCSCEHWREFNKMLEGTK